MARKRTRALERLESRRQLAEDRLSDLRQVMDRKLGSWTRRGGWAIPLVAFACGMALAVSLGRKKARRDSAEEG